MGTVTGVIRDTQGNAVAGAVVTLRYSKAVVGYEGDAVASNLRVFTANGSGEVTMADLVPGVYAVTVSVPSTSQAVLPLELRETTGTVLSADPQTFQSFLDTDAGTITPSILQQATAQAAAAAASAAAAAASAASIDLSSIAITGGTINGVAIGDTTPATVANVDNLRLDGNTMSSTNTDGDIVLAPNGSGGVVTDNLRLDGNTISSTNTDGDINLAPNGTGSVTAPTRAPGDNGTGVATTAFVASAIGAASDFFVPTGGDTGQLLRKQSNASGDTGWGDILFSEERIFLAHPSSFVLGTSSGSTWAFGGDALSSSLQWFYVTRINLKLVAARFLVVWNPDTGASPTYVRLVHADSGPANITEIARVEATNTTSPIVSAVDVLSSLQGLLAGGVDKQLGYQMLGNGGNGPKAYKVSLELSWSTS